LAVENYTTTDSIEIDSQVGNLNPYSWPGFELLFHDWQKLNGSDLNTGRSLTNFTSDLRELEELWGVWNSGNFATAQELADPTGYRKSLFEWTLTYTNPSQNPWTEIPAQNFFNNFRSVGFDFPTTRTINPIPIFNEDRTYVSQSNSREAWYKNFIKYSRLKDMGSLNFRQAVFRGYHNNNNTDYLQSTFKPANFFETIFNRDVKVQLLDRWADTILNADPYTQMPGMPAGISQRDYAFYELQLARILTGSFFNTSVFNDMSLARAEYISPAWIYENVEVGNPAYIPGAQNAFGSIGGKIQAGVGLSPIIPWTSEYWKQNGDLWRYMRAEYIKIWHESAQHKAFAYWHYKLNGKDWNKAISKTPMLKNSGQPGVGHYGLIYNAKGIEYNFVNRFTNWKTYRGVSESDFETLEGPPTDYERIYADFTDSENFDGSWTTVGSNYINTGSSSAESAPATRIYTKLTTEIPDTTVLPYEPEVSITGSKLGLSCLGTPLGSMYVGASDAEGRKPVTCSEALAHCLTLNAYWGGESQQDAINRCVELQKGNDTPLTNYNYKKGVVDDNASIKEKYFAAFNPEQLGSVKAGNNSPFYAKPYSGNKFIPSTAKAPKRIKLSELQEVGFSQELSTDRYVNQTTQRVSGGFVIPLAKKLTTIARESTPLQSYDANEEPWAKNLQNLLNLNKTSRTISYQPVKVGSQYYVNGQPVSNITSGTPKTEDSITVPFDDTPTIPTTSQPASPSPGFSATQEEDVFIPEPLEYAEPFDDIKYNNVQMLDITPLEFGPGGFLEPAGPPARVEFRAPVPSVTIPQGDLTGLSRGSELLLNGRKVIFRGNGVIDIATQVNCLRSGIRAEVSVGSDGGEEIVLSSCDGMPFNIANGCGSGKYKQVGDFHINRGFEQRADNHKTIAKTANATIFSANDVIGGTYPVTKGTQSSTKPYPQSYLKTELIDQGRSPFLSLRHTPDELDDPENATIDELLKAKYYDFDPDPNLERFVEYVPKEEELRAMGFKKGEAPNVWLPQVTETESNVSVYSTGGSGYAIGDRLRLVGGTPVQDPRGPLTMICIDSAGAGYTDPNYIQIVIDSSGNNGEGSGIGAAAVVRTLDENGGIASIELLNGGFGYDYNSPPEVTVIDYSPKVAVSETINDAWTPQLTVVPNTLYKVTREVQEFDVNGNATGTTEIFDKFVRSVRPATIGESHTIPIVSLNRNPDGSLTDNREDRGYGNADVGLGGMTSLQGVYWVDPDVEPHVRQAERARIVLNNNGLMNGLDIGEALRTQSYVEIGHYPISDDVTKILDANVTYANVFGNSGNANDTHHSLVLNNVDGIEVGDLVVNTTYDADEDRGDIDLANTTRWHGYVTSVDENTDTVVIELESNHWRKQAYDSTFTYSDPGDNSLDYKAGDTITFGHKRYTLFWVPKSLQIESLETPPTIGASEMIPGNTYTIKNRGFVDWRDYGCNEEKPPVGTTFVMTGDASAETSGAVYDDNYMVDSVIRKENDQYGAFNFSPYFFEIQHQTFVSGEAVNAVFPRHTRISIEARSTWITDYNTPPEYEQGVDWWTETVNPNMQKVPAKLSALIGIDPASLGVDRTGLADLLSPNAEMSADSKGMEGPLRVAKFIVNGIDDSGGITSLKCIDRGLYEIFPSDLTYGIPLEYDYEPIGFSGQITKTEPFLENFFSSKAKVLGIGDPSRNNIFYSDIEDSYNIIQGFSATIDNEIVEAGGKTGVDVHPEYAEGTVFNETGTLPEYGTNFKHPDWIKYPEFIYTGFPRDPNGTTEDKLKWVKYNGSPGAYDPSVFVLVDYEPLLTSWPTPPTDAKQWETFAEQAYNLGLLLRKEYAIEFDPNATIIDEDGNEVNNYGKYMKPKVVPGGTGARVFLTSQNVPNCNEKGTIKEQLNLPDVVQEINAPADIARRMRDAFSGVGYDPDDLNATIDDGRDIVPLTIKTSYPGIRVQSPTGDPQGPVEIPLGDYNVASYCIEGTIDVGGLSQNAATDLYKRKVQELIDSGQLGVLEADQIRALVGPDRNVSDDAVVMTMLCVDTVGRPPQPTTNGNDQAGNPINFERFPLNDNNSLFGDGDAESWMEVYEYDLQTLQGGNVFLTGSSNQVTPVMVFESKRFNDNNILAIGEEVDSQNIYVQEPKAWVDNFVSTEANISLDAMPGFIQGGWAYLEYGVPIRWQTELVDVDYIQNSIIYDPETGNKEFDLNLWDPFKGVLPGFMDNEIHYITDIDPVNYNSARTLFGKDQVGKVWWDTSTVKYTWYEQGPLEERAKNWGRAFPGSSITVCEWVESKSLPQNWTGDGTPRWTNQYVTERRLDTNGEYKQMYYYWVMNRTKVDNRSKRDLGRKVDTRTLARYIANPIGYGIKLLTAISNDTLVLSNVDKDIDQEVNLQVNINNSKNNEGINHTAWKLLRENDDSNKIPDFLIEKLIDSICGQDILGNMVPANNLSEIEKYGIAVRPRQTMFCDIKEARRLLVSKLNEILADTKLNTEYKNWNIGLSTNLNYVNTVNYYETIRVDEQTNQKIRYNDSYKPTYKVASIEEMDRLTDLPDATVVQVQYKNSRESKLFLYNAPLTQFDLVSIKDETIEFSDRVYIDEPNTGLALELREVLTALINNVFATNGRINEIFFELMKFAYLEQGELSWAFKTSYVYIEKEESDLIKFNGFKPDNFEKVLSYMEEVKPFSSKIREYKDGKKTPIDIIGQNALTDFDKPPYVDPITNSIRILDDFDREDSEIMRQHKRYVDYYKQRLEDMSTNPLRKVKSTLVFDRTNWRLTTSEWDKSNVTLSDSIGQNIANLNLLSNANITARTSTLVPANATIRATDRIFKYDQEVQNMFASEVNAYFNTANASANLNIIGNAELMSNMVEANRLNGTFALIKDKVGGNFRGEELDGYNFTTIPDDIYYTTEKITEFGYSSLPYDDNTDKDTSIIIDNEYGTTTVGTGDLTWDRIVELQEYEGVFKGNATIRRDGNIKEGFDGITFQRVGYGEERPEELALLDPLESLIMTVTTSAHANGSIQSSNVTVNSFSATESSMTLDSDILVQKGSKVTVTNVDNGNSNIKYTLNAVVSQVADASIQLEGAFNDVNFANSISNVKIVTVPVSPSAKEVVYRVHNNLLGGTDYVRIRDKTSTYLTSNIEINSRQIKLNDGSFLPQPTSTTPGMVWVGSERIHYGRKVGNTLSMLTRGVFGTSIETHTVNTPVYSSQTLDHFNDLNPESNIWLDLGIIYDEIRAKYDEIQAGLDGVLGTGDDIYDAWDAIEAGNITTTVVDAVVNSANSTVANVTLQSSMTLSVGEAVRLTNQSNANVYEVVSITAINGNDIEIEASYTDTLDTNLFVVNATIDFKSFDYGDQAVDQLWDAAEVISNVSLSLADRANVDFNNQYSIMKFLHNL